MTPTNFGRVHALRSMTGRSYGKGDPSVLFGDPIDVDTNLVSTAINAPSVAQDVPAAAAIAGRSEASAAERLAAYDSMSLTDKAAVTKLPPLATWNASVTVNPNLGKISADNLNYNLTKAMVEFPFAGGIADGTTPENGVATVTLNAAFINTINNTALANPGFRSLPLFRFSITSSSLNARPGANYSIKVTGKDQYGNAIDTEWYSFQRVGATEAILGIFIPFQVVVTRTLPVLPIFGKSETETADCVVTFKGMSDTDRVTITVLGYATQELLEIAQMYNLRAGLIK